MSMKKPEYNTLTTFKRGCLIFFLVIFIGIAAAPRSLGTSPKKNKGKVKTLDDYQKQLCEDVKKTKDKQDLDNFISRVSGVMTISDLKYLPGYLRNTSTEKIKQLEKNLRACQEHLTTNPKISQESKVEKQKKINDVLRGVVMILRYVKQEESLEKDIRMLYSHLYRVRKLHFSRKEWPPGSQCSKCSDYWQTLEGIVKYRRRYYRIIDNKKKKLHEIPDAVDKLKNERRRISELIRQLKAIKSNLGRLDKDFKYYSWTKTRVSVDKILELLEENTIKKICSKN